MDVVAIDDAGYLLVRDTRGNPAVLKAEDSHSFYIQSVWMDAKIRQDKADRE